MKDKTKKNPNPNLDVVGRRLFSGIAGSATKGVEAEADAGDEGTAKELSPSRCRSRTSSSSVELSTSTCTSKRTSLSQLSQENHSVMDTDEDLEQPSLVVVVQYFPFNIFNNFSFSLVEILLFLIILIVCVSGCGRGSRNWFKWGQTSMETLQASEENILGAVNTPISGILVNVGPIIDENDSKIWTIILNEEHEHEEATPLLLVHGLGAGVALWAKNLDGLAKARTVYAIDVLGFGRSSRTVFSSDPKEAEKQFVQSIEAWRIEMNLDKIILLGHSLGGYLSTSYTIAYPSRVAHLILADPWGFNTQPADLKDIAHIPLHHRIIVKMMEPLNPLWTIRLLGPLAPRLIQRIRADLISQFEGFLEDPSTKLSNYIYHCNVQNPTGEAAFHCMMAKFGWAKHPMHLRLGQLDPDIAMTVIYGANSWVDHFPISKIRELRPNSFVGAYILQGAGHHVYADRCAAFNAIVNRISASIDDENRIYAKTTRKNTVDNINLNINHDSNENYLRLEKETTT